MNQLWLSLSLLTFLMVAPVRAQGNIAGGRLAPAIGGTRRMMRELGLSPQQRRQLAALRRERRLDQIRITDALRARRRELAEMYRGFPLDEAKAGAMIQQIAALEGQHLRLQLQNQVGLRRILSRDQFARFTQLMEPGPRPAPGRPDSP